jgi:hypothetical protein
MADNTQQFLRILKQQRKKVAAARLRTLQKQAALRRLLKLADDPITAGVKNYYGGQAVSPSRKALITAKPPATTIKPIQQNTPVGINAAGTAPGAQTNLGANRPAPQLSPTISAPRSSAAAAAAQAAVGRRATGGNQQSFRRRETPTVRTPLADPTNQWLQGELARGSITQQEFDAANNQRTGLRGAWFRGGQGLQAANAAFGAGYRGLTDYMAGGNTEAGETASKLWNSAKLHATAMREGRDPVALQNAIQQAARGIPAEDRPALNYYSQAATPEQLQGFAQDYQSRIPQYTPEQQAKMLAMGETYQTALADEQARQMRDPVISPVTDMVAANMGDGGWQMALPTPKFLGLPGAARPLAGLGYNLGLNALDTPIYGNKALGVRPGVYNTPEMYAQQADASNPAQTRFEQALEQASPISNPRDARAGLGGVVDRLTGTSRLAGVQTVSEPVVSADGKPLLNADGSPQIRQSFQVSLQDDDGKMRVSSVPIDAAAAAGLTPLIAQAADMPDISEVASSASSNIANNPMAKPMADSLNQTGRAPPSTVDDAASLLKSEGKSDDQIKSLMDWWGEPGNMATALGIGATAVGLLMLFMGGQDGLMGWLMPALGITLGAGGLGTLAYTGAFGKDVQNTMQGVANPMLAQLGSFAHDSGLLGDDTYWNAVKGRMTPEQQARLRQNFGSTSYLGGTVSLPDAAVESYLKTVEPDTYAAYQQLSQTGKKQLLDHLRGTQRLGISVPTVQETSTRHTGNKFVAPEEGAQPSNPNFSWNPLNWVRS